MRQNTAHDNDNDTRGRDHQTNVRGHMPQGSHHKRWRLAGPKSHPKMRYHFRWSPSLALPQNSNPIGATRRPTRPCACRAPAIRDPPTWGAFDTKKWPYGCDGIRSRCAVTNVSGTVPRVVETFRGAPKQARPAGTQACKAGRHPRQAGRHPRQAGRSKQV